MSCLHLVAGVLIVILAVLVVPIGKQQRILVLDAHGCQAFRALGGKSESLEGEACQVTGLVRYYWQDVVIDGISIRRSTVIGDKLAHTNWALGNSNHWPLIACYGGLASIVLLGMAVLVRYRQHRGGGGNDG